MTGAVSSRPRARAPKGGWYYRNRRSIAPWLFLAPGVLFFLVYVIFPIFQSFEISLYRWDGLGEARYVGLRNYEKLFGDRAFETSLLNNLRWLVLYLLAIPAGLGIAVFLNQTVTGIRLYKPLFFFPFVISQVVVGLVTLLPVSLFLWLLPLIAVAVFSIKPTGDYWGLPSTFEAAGNYGRAFFESDMPRYLLNSLLITVPTVFGAVLLSCMTGFALGVYRFRANLWIFFMFIVGNFVPFQILMVPVRSQVLDVAVLEQLAAKSHSRLRPPWGLRGDETPRGARWLMIAAPTRRAGTLRDLDLIVRGGS